MFLRVSVEAACVGDDGAMLELRYLEPYFDLSLCETQGVGDLDSPPA